MKRVIPLFCLLLAGCASTPPKKVHSPEPKDKVSWQIHQMRIQNMKNWRAEGRLAAKKGQDGGQANFTWKQSPSRYKIDVFGPFGAGHIQIFNTAFGVRLTDHQSHDYTAADPESLFQQVAGWSVPIGGMRYWILGIPDPEQKISFQRFDEKGQLAQLVQNGWEIEYERYQSHPLTPLPTKMKFKNKDASVKMIVQSWHRYG